MKPTVLNPYINFKGQAKAAMEFYHTALGGKLDMNTFKEAGMQVDPSEENNIMHAMLVTDNGIVLMASDTPSHMEYQYGTNISISLSGDNEAELRGYWDKLTAGGKISQPLSQAPWGDTFGMFTDKFEINWMVNITAPKA